VAIAIFEAVTWAAAIANRRDLMGDESVQGLHHVRDRMFHGERYGAGSPTDPDEDAGTRRWVKSENLPPPSPESRAEQHRDAYDRRLAGRPIVEVFDYFDELIKAT
jgi:hypothetical protein